MSEIILFFLILFSFFKYLNFLALFLALFPFILFFLFLRKRELKKGKTPSIFFFYFFSIGIFYYLFVRFYIRVPFSRSPWLLLLLLFLNYFLIEVFVRFMEQGRYGMLIFFISFFALFLNPSPLLIVFIPLLLFISLVHENVHILRFEYGNKLIEENIVYKWWRYSYISIGFIVFFSVFVAFYPVNVHIHRPRLNINNPLFFKKPSHPPTLAQTPKKQSRYEKVVTLYKYKKMRNIPSWMRRLALWHPDKSLLVDILLLEFGLFVLLFVFKIFSGMRYWYIFLGLSIVFTVLLVGFFAYIVYIMGSYILKNNANISSWGKAISFSPDFAPKLSNSGEIITKIVTIGGRHTLFFSIFLNIGLLITIILSIAIIFIVILKIMKKIKIEGYIEIPKEKMKENENTFSSFDSSEFLKILEKDQRYALEYLYKTIREKFYKDYAYLTPYEFLKKIKKGTSPEEVRFWEDITPLFVNIRYSKGSIEKDKVLSLWNNYSAIFFSM